MNALKHGLTGNTVLVKSDDADAYQSRLDEYVALSQPVNIEERHLVQSIHPRSAPPASAPATLPT
jgi:hypothetical protein